MSNSKPPRNTVCASARNVRRFRGAPLRAACLFVALAGLLLQGCAGTARGKAESAYGYDPTFAVEDASRSPADAWVVVRYPAMIDSDADAAWKDAYARQAIGGRVDNDGWTSFDADAIAEGAIAKSNFYAMSLYRALREELPPDTVLLSPHLVTTDENGALVTEPMLATESIPSVLTIDFVTYSFPDPEKMMDSPPLTFGDMVTPLAVVHADHWLRPATNGLILASEDLVASAWQQSSEIADEEFAGRLAFRPIDDARSLDFARFLNGDVPQVQVPTKPVRSDRPELAAVERYPLEKIRMDGEQVTGWPNDPAQNPFRTSFADGVSSRVERALSNFDHDRATFSDRQKLLASFDPELAFAFLAHSEDESVRARLALAEKLIEAERRFLAAQSERIYAGVFEGAYGRSMREMIAAEQRNLDQRREIAVRQNVATAVAILAMAGAAYAGSDVWDGGSYDAGKALLSDALILGSFAAVETAIAANQLGDQVGEGFLSQMAPALTEQITVQVRLAEGTREISARDYATFREQTLALYQSRVRSLTVDIETDCTYRHPEASSQGRWYGACLNGLATGRGYGVVRTDAGRHVEFLGDARSGTANGQGAMILHEPGLVGAVYYEGGFRDGRPHGEVRVEVAGQNTAWRRYEDGVDRGRGDPEAWRAFPFQ
ncbi:MAG: hypothetical protein V2I57_01345 [Xanthomonadales bacterium]|jgi:hypothetical protein|nr:hypothetical protein [Xanthomonadales bacterium]